MMAAPNMRLTFCCSVVAAHFALFAQSLKPTPQQLLQNLQQTGQLAAVQSMGATPFRLSATFSTFDYLGKPAGEGTLDESWLRPGVERRVISFRGQRSNQVMSGGSVHETAEGFNSTYLERRLIAALLDPVPEAVGPLDPKRLRYRAFKTNGGSLDCAIVSAPQPIAPQPTGEESGTAYCSDPVTHILRIRQERYDFVIVYNNLVHLGKHVLAKEVEISQSGRLRAKLTVTGFAPALDLTEASFALPPNESDLSKDRIELPEEVVAGVVLKKKQPVYPDEAKRNGVSGTVILSVVITKMGDVTDLDVISSPSPELTASAMTAVSQWKYKPYLLGGKPQDVDTTIRVNYTFGRR